MFYAICEFCKILRDDKRKKETYLIKEIDIRSNNFNWKQRVGFHWKMHK